jgi:1-acyl-sn-glycerol-3-phosphate acyltransferase
MYWVFKGTVLTVLRLWFRPKVEGSRDLPAGPVIVASNHLSFSDTFFLGAVVSRRLTFLAKSSYFNGAPIVPVAMIGTERIQPPGTVMPRMAPLSIRIGEPLNFSRYEGLPEDPAVLRSVTDEIMREVQKLSGQEYVDSYSPGPVKRGAVVPAG